MKLYRKTNKFKLNDVVIIPKVKKAGTICGFSEDIVYDHYAKCDVGTYLYMIRMADGTYAKYLELYIEHAPDIPEEPEIIPETVIPEKTESVVCEISEIDGFNFIPKEDAGNGFPGIVTGIVEQPTKKKKTKKNLKKVTTKKKKNQL